MAITDAQGAVLARFSYDAWGKRRAAIDWNTPTPGDFLTPDTPSPRGYTGHEHLDHVGLIHMNGRVYDPEIGRFLSADPFVQFPESTQGLNRYSYVGNNPLSYNDPSGFFLEKLVKTAIGIAASFINPVLGGAIMGYLSTGTLKGALLGALGGAASWGIGEAFAGLKGAGALFGKSLIHGISQGILSKAGGGRFGDGFLGGFSASLLSPITGKIKGPDSLARAARIVTAAVIGGTAAKIGGGKFANGAISGAFVQAFNDEMHRGGDGNGGNITKTESVAVGDSIFEYTTIGPEGYAEQVQKLLVDVASTDAGASLLTGISSNGGSVQFNYRAGVANTRGSLFSRDSVITYDPAHRPTISTTTGLLVEQPQFVLAHELHHAWKNTLSCWFGCSRPLVLPGSVPRGMNPWEVHAVRYTNKIRTQSGVGYQRTHYEGTAIPGF